MGESYRLFIPIIVTNARLLSASYKISDIDQDARLTRLNLQPIQAAALNHAEVLKWGSSYEKEIEHIGQPTAGILFRDDTRYKGSHNKTVFIVTKSNLVNFINKFMMHFLA